MPCGRLGKWLAFDDGGYDAAMNDERGDGATCDEIQSDIGDMLHGATFPRGAFPFILRHFGQDVIWKSGE